MRGKWCITEEHSPFEVAFEEALANMLNDAKTTPGVRRHQRVVAEKIKEDAKVMCAEEGEDDLTILISALWSDSEFCQAPTGHRKVLPKRKANDKQGLVETAEKLRAIGRKKVMTINTCKLLCDLKHVTVLEVFSASL